eukprot:TRINITY_DN112872_c0_g1_i1.p1 TRINITY_DN112872_c0_g1~~TRINITY_DN112872_c0_g1_i1.p1  ORF type:complete len:299 (-),score=73.46 TRINITY_DN112872_c0_g1_i1:84-980(-)
MSSRFSQSGNRASRRSSGRYPILFVGTAAALAAFVVCRNSYSHPGRLEAYQAVPGGMSRSQKKSNLHTRGNLYKNVVEVKEEEVVEEVPKEPLPEHRVPYSLNIVSHLPNNEHFHEESFTRKRIEEKIVTSFQIFEDLIKHFDVNMQIIEHFHREKSTHPSTIIRDLEEDLEEVEESKPVVDRADRNHKKITPYVIKASVSLHNGHIIQLANPEKHAQASMGEALDHMVDVLKKSLREEKARMIDQHHHKRKEDRIAMPEVDDMKAFAEDEEIALQEENDLQQDKEAQAMYERIEAQQ